MRSRPYSPHAEVRTSQPPESREKRLDVTNRCRKEGAAACVRDGGFWPNWPRMVSAPRTSASRHVARFDRSVTSQSAF